MSFDILSYEISGPILEMFVVQSWNSHNILNFDHPVLLCQVTVYQLSKHIQECLMASFFLRITLDHHCAKLSFAHKSKTVGFTVQPAMEGSCFVATEKCIHQMAVSTKYYTNDSIIPIEALVINISYRYMRNLNQADFNNDLNALLQLENQEYCVNDLVNNLTATIISIINKHAPIKEKRVR